MVREGMEIQLISGPFSRPLCHVHADISHTEKTRESTNGHAKKKLNLLFCQKISGSGYSSGEVYVTGHLELAGAGSVGLEVRSQSVMSQQGSLRDGGLQ